MSNNNEEQQSVGQENLESVLQQVKEEKISINDAVSHIKHRGNGRKYKKPRFFVTKSGSVGVRGVNGSRPLVLYKDQWETLERLFQSGHLSNFIEKNEDEIKQNPRHLSHSDNNNNDVDNNVNDDANDVDNDLREATA